MSKFSPPNNDNNNNNNNEPKIFSKFWASNEDGSSSSSHDDESDSEKSSNAKDTTTTTTTPTTQRLVSTKIYSPLFGGIVGDIAGSTYERHNCKSEKHIQIFKHKSKVTDDSILTLATAKIVFLRDYQGILDSDDTTLYTDTYQQFGQRYPNAGYGKSFKSWIYSNNPQPYGSYGNGSAMRVSPIGWIGTDLNWIMKEAKRSAEVTHNHPEAIKGAQAVACAIFLARKGKSKPEIKEYLENGPFNYDLDRKISDIRPNYKFDVSCQGSVPEAIIAFLESKSFESSIRKAISLGGDSDTIACIAGSIAHAYYGIIPDYMIEYCKRRHVMDTNQIQINDYFWDQYNTKWNIIDDHEDQEEEEEEETVDKEDVL